MSVYNNTFQETCNTLRNNVIKFTRVVVVVAVVAVRATQLFSKYKMLHQTFIVVTGIKPTNKSSVLVRFGQGQVRVQFSLIRMKLVRVRLGFSISVT